MRKPDTIKREIDKASHEENSLHFLLRGFSHFLCTVYFLRRREESQTDVMALTLRVMDRGGFCGGSSCSLSPRDAKMRFLWPIKLIFKT